MKLPEVVEHKRLTSSKIEVISIILISKRYQTIRRTLMPKYSSLNQFLYENKRLQCNVRGCTSMRVGKSQYCGKHRARAYVWGHPEGSAVKPYLYSDEIEAVTKLVKHNESHEGIILGRKWLANMMEAGGRGADIRGSMYWANLYNQKISSSELLIKLGALWLLDYRDELNRVIKNHKHLISLSGNTVIRFGKMYGIKYVPPKIYHQVGDQVKKGIGVLLVNFSRTIEKMKLKERQRLSRMAKELNVDGL